MNINRRTTLPTLIKAMQILSHDIASEDGIANAAIAEAADRMIEMRNALDECEHVCKEHGETRLLSDIKDILQ